MHNKRSYSSTWKKNSPDMNETIGEMEWWTTPGEGPRKASVANKSYPIEMKEDILPESGRYLGRNGQRTSLSALCDGVSRKPQKGLGGDMCRYLIIILRGCYENVPFTDL